MKITRRHSDCRPNKAFARSAVCTALLVGVLTPGFAAAQCPTAFRLSGSAIDKQWSKVTTSAWLKMLPKGWTDKGFHFYSQVRRRGPDGGIGSPSDLESEIVKKLSDQAAPPPASRRAIVLPIQDYDGKSVKVFYDYAGGKTSKCELVTITFKKNPKGKKAN
jgi:hypothetical protein